MVARPTRGDGGRTSPGAVAGRMGATLSVKRVGWLPQVLGYGHRCARLCAVLALWGAAGVVHAEETVVLAGFEDGLGSWETTQAALPGGALPTESVRIYQSRSTHATGGQSCMFVMFPQAVRCVARVFMPISGADLATKDARALSFWVRPYGPGSSVQMVFSGTDGAGQAHEYIATLHLAEADWTQVVVPLGKFTENGAPMADLLRSMTSFAFRKVGTWEPVHFRIDDLAVLCGAAPAPPAGEGPGETAVTEAPTGPQPTPGEATEQPTPPDRVRPGAEGPEPAEVSPPVGPAETATPEAALAGALPEPGPAYSQTVSVRFQDLDPPVPYRPALGGSVLLKDAPLLGDERVAARLRVLGLTILRVRVAVPASFALSDADLGALDAIVGARNSVGAKSVMICLDLPFDAKLDAPKLAEFAAGLARRYNVEKRTPVTYWELFNAPAFLGTSDQVLASKIANAAAKALKQVDPNIRPGGLGFSSPGESKLRSLMETATDLVFYSWHFYGSQFVDTTPEQIMSSAHAGVTYGSAEPYAPASVEALLRSVGQGDRLLLVTECNANSVRDSDAARDPRLSTPLNAAWLASAAMSFAPYVDVMVVSRLVGDGWGILREDGTPCAAYWAAYLLTRDAVRGSHICMTDTQDTAVRALATRGEKTRQVVLVNQRNAPAAVTLRAEGLAIGASVAARVVENTDAAELRTQPLVAAYEPVTVAAAEGETPVTTFTGTLRVELPPFGVAALDFDEARPQAAR